MSGSNGKNLGVIVNCDIDGNLVNLGGSCALGNDATPEKYKRVVLSILDLGMKVLAQNVGMPDPVIYPSQVATTWDKYRPEMGGNVMGKLLEAGTDPLTLTIEACRERGVLIVASYRMNAEDAGFRELDIYDFGRAHKDWAIPGRNCLDPAIPQVYQHRMDIFREVAENYDIDGIEFDFKRWFYMISDPLKNYPILTQMVRDTRRMLDEVAKQKGRKKLLLGARVEPMLEGEFGKENFPGAYYDPPINRSCRDSGLDVKTWIQEGLVDYVCPAFFAPFLPGGMPRTAEFAKLSQGTKVGIYPDTFCRSWWWHKNYMPGKADYQGWYHEELPYPRDTEENRLRYRNDIILWALQMYQNGADGISTFNAATADPELWTELLGRERREDLSQFMGSNSFYKILRAVHQRLGSPQALRELLAQAKALPKE